MLIFIRLVEVINEKVKAPQTHSSWLLKLRRLACRKVSAPGVRLGRLGLGSPCHRPPCVPSSLPPCCFYGYLISCSSVFMEGRPDGLCAVGGYQTDDVGCGSARVVMAEMSGQGSWPHDQNNGSGSGKVG